MIYHVSCESLFPHEFESVQYIEDDDFVVHGLTSQPFTCNGKVPLHKMKKKILIIKYQYIKFVSQVLPL